MKYLISIFLLLPFLVSAQTQVDYEHAFARFAKYYNNMQGDSIKRMWPRKEAEAAWMDRMWGQQELPSLHKEYGTILSYKYIGIDTEDPNPGLAVFKTQFSIAGWKTSSLTLEQGNYLGTFRFITSSDGIDKLLKEKK